MPSSPRIGQLLLLLSFLAGPADLYAQYVQQAKLVGTGSSQFPYPNCTCPGPPSVSQGWSVSISADGNTAIVNGFGDDNPAGGAAWIFMRSNGVWTQQGSKLVGSGNEGPPAATLQSVAISADGNTALFGRSGDNNLVGAAWVFTRSNSSWAQQGDKLVGAGSVGPFQGIGQYVAISADGNTAVIDGAGDDHFIGAGWVFTRSDGVWTQQGDKLVTSSATGHAMQCCAKTSADGSTILFAMTPIPIYGEGNGYASVFTRSNGVWTQQGSALVPSDVGGSIYLLPVTALSADGNTVLLSGYDRNTSAAYGWIFTRSNGVWMQQGSRLEATKPLDPLYLTNYAALSPDASVALVNNTLFVRNREDFWKRSGSIQAQPGPVAFSYDASTLILGQPTDNDGLGAALVFTRNRLENTEAGRKPR